VGTTGDVADGGRLRRLDGLFEALKRRRQEGDGREHASMIDAAPDTPAIVVKSAWQTIAFAGYHDVSFVVREAGAP
jgi:hypothetical protein